MWKKTILLAGVILINHASAEAPNSVISNNSLSGVLPPPPTTNDTMNLNIPGSAPTPLPNAGKSLGSKIIKEQKVSNFEHFGPATIESAELSGKTSIYGPLNASKATFDDLGTFGPANFDECTMSSLDANGPIQITASTIKNNTIVRGPVHAIRSSFQEIRLHGDEFTFDNSSAKKIIIHLPSHQTDKPQVLFLRGTSVDEVVFESGKGVLVLEADASVKKHSGADVKKN